MPLAISIKPFHAKSQQDDTASTLAMEIDGGFSLGLTSLFFKHGCGSTIRRAQSHLKWCSLYFYLPFLTLFGTSASSVKDCQKQGQGALVTLPLNEAQAANPPAGTGIIGVPI